MNLIALIPARFGSQRILDKNIKDFFGHPLIAYTIRAALESGVFDELLVSSNSPEYLDIAEKYGAKVIMRPVEHAQSTSSDFGWVCHAVLNTKKNFDAFAILRPTNPFRTVDTIHRALKKFKAGGGRSLRAIEKCKQHPHKMWIESENKGYFIPLQAAQGIFHNMSYQSLFPAFVQNGCLDISLMNVLKEGTIIGNKITPFFTEGYEGFDINTNEDWILAEELVKRGMVQLPEVKI